MEQSISFKIGKGSIAHNARDFTASNVDSNRSQYNIEYVNKDLKQTYHELFDDAWVFRYLKSMQYATEVHIIR